MTLLSAGSGGSRSIRSLAAPGIVVTAVLMGLTGCQAGTTDPPEPHSASAPATSPSNTPASSREAATSAPESSAASPSASSAAPSASRLDATAAVGVALTEVSGGAVVELDQGRSGGTRVWEVVVRHSDGTGVELYIDEQSGQVLRKKSAELEPYARSAGPSVDAREAIEIATGDVNGVVVDMGLGQENGRTVWEVEVAPTSGLAQELSIDATSGDIVKRENA